MFKDLTHEEWIALDDEGLEDLVHQLCVAQGIPIDLKKWKDDAHPLQPNLVVYWVEIGGGSVRVPCRSRDGAERIANVMAGEVYEEFPTRREAYNRHPIHMFTDAGPQYVHPVMGTAKAVSIREENAHSSSNWEAVKEHVAERLKKVPQVQVNWEEADAAIQHLREWNRRERDLHLKLEEQACSAIQNFDSVRHLLPTYRHACDFVFGSRVCSPNLQDVIRAKLVKMYGADERPLSVAGHVNF